MRLIFQALSSVTNVKVLAAPQLLVIDNQTANIRVGEQRPVITRQSTSTTDASAPIVSEVQFQDVGVLMTVTPSINAGGLVTLEISQEVSSAQTAVVPGTNQTAINQRSIESKVAVQSGETILLGGLIREDTSNSSSRVPLLGDVPLVGLLFRSDTNSVARTELIFLISPRVLNNSSEARAVTEELRRRLRGIRLDDLEDPGYTNLR